VSEAEALLQKSVSLKPDFVEAWQSLGQVRLLQKSYARARDAFLRALKLDPANAQAHLGLGHVFMSEGDDAGAQREFESALKSSTGDEEIRAQAQGNLGLLHLKLAGSYSEKNLQREAVRELEMAKELLPASSELYHLLGAAYLQLRDPRAVEVLRKALELNPTEQAWESLGQAFADNRQYDEAIGLFSERVKAQPDNSLFRILLGEAFWNRSEYQSALEQFERAVTLSPRSGRAHFSVGYTHQLLGNLTGARASLEMALRLDPEIPLANLAMGNLLAGEGKREEAIPFLEKYAQKKPKDSGVHLKLGQIYLDNRKLDLALAALKTAERLAPNDRKVHYLLGRLYTASNRPALARKEFSIFDKLEAEELERKRLKKDTPYVKQD
ncbi:MAG: tetratricopeptide repeat protein, partial [Acidobacteria bacterium]|nr:tetratricopeptide repeat protein [Acidobacteriota bacterium]